MLTIAVPLPIAVETALLSAFAGQGIITRPVRNITIDFILKSFITTLHYNEFSF
jgi:hypothetical protein